MNKTLPVFTAALLNLTTSLRRGVSSQKLYILPAVTIGGLAASVRGRIVALTARIQKPSPAEAATPPPPVIATGSVWGVGA